MNIKHPLVLAFAISSSVLFAQNYHLSKGNTDIIVDQILDVNPDKNEAYIEYSPKLKIFHKALTTELYLATADLNSFDLKNKLEVDLPEHKFFGLSYNPDQRSMIKPIMLGQHIVYFTYNYNKNSQVITVYATPVEVQTLKKGTEIKIKAFSVADWKKMDRAKPKKYDFDEGIKIRFSNDRSKIVVFFEVPLSEKDDYAIDYWYTVLDQNLETLYKGTYKLPYSGENYGSADWNLSDDGAFYINGFRYNDGEYPARTSVVFELSEEGVKEYLIEMEHYPRDVFPVFAGADVYAVGYFTPKGYKGSHGTYTAKLNDGKVSNLKIQNFERSLIARVQNAYDSEDWEEKKYGIPYLTYRGTLHNADGSFTVLAEHEYSYEASSSSEDLRTGMKTRTSYTKYKMYDYYLVNFDQNAKRKWVARYHKMQVGMDGNPQESYPSVNFMSCNVIRQGDKYFLFYNDQEENFELDDRDQIESNYIYKGLIKAKTIMSKAVFDANGKLEGASIMKGLEKGMLVHRTNPLVTDKGVLLINEKNKVQYFMTLGK